MSTSVSNAPQAPILQNLTRTGFSVGLRGAYPKLASVMARTLDRFPDLIVQRWALKRLASSVGLQAHVELLLTRPLAASNDAH